MADVINLNKERKRRARDEAQRQAAANRVRYGRTKAQRERDAAEAEEARRRLEQLRRETPDDERAGRHREKVSA
jgi:hypothetical protein